jgi:hypothetical protein
MDRPGGGDSGQPFIQSPIETIETAPSVRNLYEANRTSLDFPIRGGSITSILNGSYSTNSALIDRERIQRFIESAPRGVAFVQKQVGLQLSNPKTQVPNSLAFAGISIGNAVLPTTQVYNPLNTLAQVAVQGTGAHFNRHGVVPTIYESPQQTYAYIVGAPENNTQYTNRLAILRALKLVGDTGFTLDRNVSTGLGIDPLLVDRLGISTIQGQLFNYSGGPGSVYGIGNTRINRTTNTQPTEDPSTGLVYSTMAFTYANIANQDTYNGSDKAHPIIQDFRSKLPNNGHNQMTATSSYAAYGMTKRFNIGSPGAVDNRLDYSDTSKPAAVDRLNALNPFFFNPSLNNPWTVNEADLQKATPGALSGDTKDIIKFAFECLSNDVDAGTGKGAEQSVALVFRAFLDGSITDSNQASYNSFKYLGRGETFRTYQGVDRTMSFSFKIFTQTRSEMQPLYKKLNWLISQVYPDYSPTYNLMRGNVVRLTIGDYIHRMPGFLENVNVTIDNSNTSWEILLGEYNEEDVRQLPHIISVSCTFKPILDILPRRENYSNQFVPLIVNGDNYLNPNPPVRGAVGEASIVPVGTSVQQTGEVSRPLTGNVQGLGTTVPAQQQKLVPKVNKVKANEAKPKKGQGIKLPNSLARGRQYEPILRDNTVNVFGTGQGPNSSGGQ